jgi:light-regulated signal transduction histidine kinase (bacteriophytochrome)
MLRQIWMNLVSNAIKYSSGKSDPFIRIGEKLSGDEITFFIKDNGVGFDMKYSEKLFAVFHRLHGSDVFEGTGVGLSIVKRLVTKHGGQVWAEAEKGVGATFYFTIPLEK